MPNLMSVFLPFRVANIAEPKAGQKMIYKISLLHSATSDCVVAAPPKDSSQLRSKHDNCIVNEQKAEDSV